MRREGLRRKDPSRDGPVMTMVCFYCGHTSSSMQQAARHEARRPESCIDGRRLRNPPPDNSGERISEILTNLTVEGGGNLDRELDASFERLRGGDREARERHGARNLRHNSPGAPDHPPQLS
jgi:hypothetical protein